MKKADVFKSMKLPQAFARCTQAQVQHSTVLPTHMGMFFKGFNEPFLKSIGLPEAVPGKEGEKAAEVA